MISVTIPGMRLVNETNAREHWRARARRAKSQRACACDLVRLEMWATNGAPRPGFWNRQGVVTITRLGPRALDSDNLAASAKHVRDGVADALGLDDGDARLTWLYGQERGSYGVRIEIADGDRVVLKAPGGCVAPGVTLVETWPMTEDPRWKAWEKRGHPLIGKAIAKREQPVHLRRVKCKVHAS